MTDKKKSVSRVGCEASFRRLGLVARWKAFGEMQETATRKWLRESTPQQRIRTLEELLRTPWGFPKRRSRSRPRISFGAAIRRFRENQNGAESP